MLQTCISIHYKDLILFNLEYTFPEDDSAFDSQTWLVGNKFSHVATI